MLATEPMPEAHTGENISKCLKKLLDFYAIGEQKVHLILRDAASSMINAVGLLGIESFDCFCHKINLALTDGLEHRNKSVPEIKKQIQLCRDLVGFFNRSKNFQNILEMQQELIGAPKNGLIQDVVTRWNSTLYMINRLVQQQRALTLSQIDFPGTVLPDFELLKALSEVLTPFDTFTKQLSQRNESISTVLPIFRCLLLVLAEKEIDTSEIKSLKKVIGFGLKSRMEKHENKRFLVIATLIDPRYKNHQNIFSYEDRIQNKVLLQMEIELFINPQRRVSDSEATLNYEPLPTQSDNPLSNFLFPTTCGSVDSTQSQNDLSNVIINEIDSFFKSPTIEFDADPLLFWRGNSTYPNIKQIVPKYLAPPPGTVESERTFSQLSEIFSPKRSSLSAAHAMQQIFLHFNFDE